MYAIRWKAKAVDDLAEIWLRATDRADVTRAADRIDPILRQNPNDQGESRDAGRRIMVERPLAVSFKVDTDSATVWILGIWRIDRR